VLITATTRMLSKTLRLALQAGSFLLWVAGALIALELISRLLHMGTRPVVPSIQDELGHYRMVPDFSSSIRLPGGRTYRVCTDHMGLRMLCGVANPEAPASTLVVGDSQASGWGLPWEDSIGGRLEAASGHFTKTLATAGNDVETIQFWMDDYYRFQRVRPRQVIFVFNLGNDLDELILNRAHVIVPTLRKSRNWLSGHSFLFLDVNLLKYVLTGGDFSFPPGANPVVFALNESERDVLAISAASMVAELRHRCCDATVDFEVLLLPGDYQVHAEQFTKYRPFYHSAAEYQKWEASVPLARQRLDEIATRIVEELNRKHIAVSRADEVLAALPGPQAFQGASHHLTAEAVRAVVDSLRGKLHRETEADEP
jgi:hypothetical protein